jgi:Na(+)-translocating NADH:ubiquinone oxidoreductase F subunit
LNRIFPAYLGKGMVHAAKVAKNSRRAILPLPCHAMSTTTYNRYILNETNSARAIEQGLAEADWYTSPIPKAELRKLLERRDGPALRDTILWFGLLLASGIGGFLLWGSWWAILPFAIYGVIYGTTSDSRWHESSHGTAFRTDWMNNALYEIASFMVMREATVWRWSHTRHHSDTIIVGRDPEIAVPRPPDIKAMLMVFFNLNTTPKYFRSVFRHAFGRLTGEEASFIPATEHGKVFFRARLYLLIYAGVIAAAVSTRSILPLMFIGLPNLYGAWLMPIYGDTQHAGLAENVLDHRLNCRTVYMNRLNRFLYWNMNYHVEHHMFPLVPYHALPRLHELVKADMPTPYSGLLEAWREIIPAVLRQVKDPGYFVKRKIPTPTHRQEAAATATALTARGAADADGWIEVCPAISVGKEDVVRFDHAKRTYAIYQTAAGQYHATDGICTHGNTHLAAGLVKGNLIECAKHNGRFDITDGSPQRPPVCVALRTYPIEQRNGSLFLNLNATGGVREQQTYAFRVVSNENVATFIKELVLEPLEPAEILAFTPGDYLQFDIPAFGRIAFRDLTVDEPFRAVWEANHVVDYAATHPIAARRNYSIASNGDRERTLRFNIRIATPPRGQECPAGAGSTYMWKLKAGDTVFAIGPFGDFHIKPTQKEMVYIGGGAGMAPLRAHLSHLFESLHTARKVSFWYGARSRQELFYQDYFGELARRYPNFKFHPALSEPLPEDGWTASVGFIHEVVRREYLSSHPNLKAVEFYLCGPPAMIQACTTMLASLGVADDQIAYDEF